jgi:hypothetical protein
MIDYAQILSVNYPNEQWTLNGDSYEGLTWFSDTPKPTQAELDALALPTQEAIAKQSCKKQASELLYETDWTTIPDVADSANTPYLTNQAEFITWRSQIRALAINPVVDPVFPPKPNEVWG